MSIVIYDFGLVRILKDEDASGWVVGASIYKEWLRKGVGLFQLPAMLSESFSGNHRGYGYMLGGLFYMTDAPARLPAAVLNCFIGALTVVMAYRIARSLFSEWVAIRVAWWTCLLPSMIIWSAQTLKEPTVIFLETIVLYGCVRLKVKGFSLRHIIACGLAIILVLPFRFYAAYVAGAAVALALAIPQFGKRKLSVGSAIGVAACVLPIVMMSSVLVSSEAQIERFDLKRIEKFRQDIAVGAGSGVTSSYDVNSPIGLGVATLVGGSYLMLAPFPWQLGGGSIRMALTTPELIVWWWVFFVGVLPGIWHAIRTRFYEIQPLLFFLLGLGVLYSLMFGNVGLAYRQRAQLLPWLLIFAMVGLEQRMLRRSAKKQDGSRARPDSQAPTTIDQGLPALAAVHRAR
jgi:4-amino-4-deoxy-L-arabinose transferase-like glycosyltransferase